MKVLSFDEFAKLYCDTQMSTPEDLRAVLLKQIQRYTPTGFMLLECQVLDSSRLGQRVILPYGPQNTFREPPSPTQCISPRGLASDMSIVIAVMSADAV